MRLLKRFGLTAVGVVFAVSAMAAEEAPAKSVKNFAARAADKPAAKEKAAAAPAAAAPAAVKADASREAKKKQLAEKKKELNGSQWSISLVPSDGKGSPEPDELTFQDGKVSFESFGKMGFGSSNYTISVPEGSEIAVWETMQNSEKSGILFVRGEWKDDQMTGIISHQDPDQPEKPAKDYTFTTQKKIAISPESAKKDETAAPAASASGVLSSGPKEEAQKQ
jgi:hypothetical protein